MTDLFEEVEEQIRSDRYRALALKAMPWILGILGAALIAGLAYWGWDHFRTQATNEASEQYAAAVESMGKGDKAGAVRQWTEVSQSSARGYKSLALMQLGGLQIADGKTAEAVKLFDQAADAAPGDVIGDAARLKSAFALLDTAPYSDVEARLTPLMEDGHPYRVQAREALAFAKLNAGNLTGARGDFVVISGMLDAPDGARGRAKAAIDLIDSGSAKALPAAVKAAAALPPPAQPGQLPPGMVLQGAPQSQAPGPQ